MSTQIYKEAEEKLRLGGVGNLLAPFLFAACWFVGVPRQNGLWHR